MKHDHVGSELLAVLFSRLRSDFRGRGRCINVAVCKTAVKLTFVYRLARITYNFSIFHVLVSRNQTMSGEFKGRSRAGTNVINVMTISFL